MAAGGGALLHTSARLRNCIQQHAAITPALLQLASSSRSSVQPPNRSFTSHNRDAAPGLNSMALNTSTGSGISLPPLSSSYFQRPSLPANTIVRFVPQQTAWVVERMGKFKRVLEPGLAVLIPFLDRIAYVKSLKEVAIEIPSQSAITADNVTLDLDGVLYTRVFDPYKAR